MIAKTTRMMGYRRLPWVCRDLRCLLCRISEICPVRLIEAYAFLRENLDCCRDCSGAVAVA
jgi:hypothetical protein